MRVVHPRRVVLQLSPGLSPDRELMHACERLVADGYRFAIDAVDVLRSPELVHIARLVKLDATTLEPDIIAVPPTACTMQARVLVNHIPNRAVRDRCQAAGVELFEGYQFARVDLVARRDISVDHAQAFRLLKIIRDPDAADSAIEEAFRRDLALTYKLLRLVNSAWAGGRDIVTIGHAIRLVGRDALYRWLSLLLIEAESPNGAFSSRSRTCLSHGPACANGSPRSTG